MSYSLPLQAYICQKGIRNVFPSATSRLLPGHESAFPPIQSINSSPSSVLLTPLEAGRIGSVPPMVWTFPDVQSAYTTTHQTTQSNPTSHVEHATMQTSSLPLPAVEYFVHVAWDVINGKTELNSESALHLAMHPPTPPPQARFSQPEPAFRDYIHRLIATTAVSQSVVIIALFYLYSARAELQRQLILGDVVDKRLGYSMCAASLMLGNKYLDDNTYTSRTWATLSGYSLWEINDCEKRLLHALNFQLNISLTEYNDWRRFLALYVPSSLTNLTKSKLDTATTSRPLTAESWAPIMPVSQRRVSRPETLRPTSRKRSLAEPEVPDSYKRVMLSTHQHPLATSHSVPQQDDLGMYAPVPYSVPPPQLYPCTVESNYVFQEYPFGYYKLAASPVDPRAENHYRKFQLVEPQPHLQPQPQSQLYQIPAARTCQSFATYPSAVDPWHTAQLTTSSFDRSIQPHVTTTAHSNGQEHLTTFGDNPSLQSRKAYLTSVAQADEQMFASHQLSIYPQTIIDYANFQ